MKKLSVMALLAVTGLAPFMSGCKGIQKELKASCTDVQNANKTIELARQAFEAGVQDRSYWEDSCKRLHAIQIDVQILQMQVESKKKDICKDADAQVLCGKIKGYALSIASLDGYITNTCKNLDADGADPTDEEQSVGLNMSNSAKRAIKMIDNELTPNAAMTVALWNECGPANSASLSDLMNAAKLLQDPNARAALSARQESAKHDAAPAAPAAAQAPASVASGSANIQQ